MGASKNKKTRFLAEHPMCYFCGANSTTIDHVPSRECFKNRIGPEGFEFPACAECNNGSGQLEQVVALYLHMANHDVKEPPFAQYTRLIGGVANNNANYLPRLMGANERRRAARAMNYSLRPGETYAEAPIVELPPENAQAFELFERRLTCALFYKHIGKIMPSEVMMRTMHLPFVNQKAEKLLEGIMPNMAILTKTNRQNTDIGEQFAYAWNSKKAEDFFIFVAQFSKSYFVVGIAARPNKETRGGYRAHSKDIVASAEVASL